MTPCLQSYCCWNWKCISTDHDSHLIRLICFQTEDGNVTLTFIENYCTAFIQLNIASCWFIIFVFCACFRWRIVASLHFFKMFSTPVTIFLFVAEKIFKYFVLLVFAIACFAVSFYFVLPVSIVWFLIVRIVVLFWSPS